jgi:hypothetical protein
MTERHRQQVAEREGCYLLRGSAGGQIPALFGVLAGFFEALLAQLVGLLDLQFELRHLLLSLLRLLGLQRGSGGGFAKAAAGQDEQGGEGRYGGDAAHNQLLFDWAATLAMR